MPTIPRKLLLTLLLGFAGALGAAPALAHRDAAARNVVARDSMQDDWAPFDTRRAHLVAPSRALTVAAGGDWDELSADEQRALARHRQQWHQYSPQQRARLREGVQRYMNLSPQERNEVQRGHERYERMSPTERERERERYRRERGRD